MPDALEEYVMVILDQADLSDRIQEEPDLTFLGRLNFRTIFEDERIADSHVKEAKLLSLIEKVDKSNELMATKFEKLEKSLPGKSEGAAILKIEKVRVFNF